MATISKKRARDFDKLKSQASDVWDDQKEALGKAGHFWHDVGVEAATVAVKDVAPRVKSAYENQVKPAVVSAASQGKDRLVNDVAPAVSDAVKSSSVGQAVKDSSLGDLVGSVDLDSLKKNGKKLSRKAKRKALKKAAKTAAKHPKGAMKVAKVAAHGQEEPEEEGPRRSHLPHHPGHHRPRCCHLRCGADAPRGRRALGRRRRRHRKELAAPLFRTATPEGPHPSEGAGLRRPRCTDVDPSHPDIAVDLGGVPCPPREGLQGDRAAAAQPPVGGAGQTSTAWSHARRRRANKHRRRRGRNAKRPNSGAWENRTPDILLAKQALYQLS